MLYILLLVEDTVVLDKHIKYLARHSMFFCLDIGNIDQIEMFIFSVNCAKYWVVENFCSFTLDHPKNTVQAFNTVQLTYAVVKIAIF